MSKHTPGPWKLRPITEKSERWGFITFHEIDTPSRVSPIAVVNPASRDDVLDEGFSNAYLISAAPEMLDALEVFRKVLLKNLESCKLAGDKEAHFTINTNLSALEAILKKAKGE